MASRIFRDKNRIHFQGEFRINELTRPLAGLHHAVQTAGYRELVLDFSECTAAFAPPMLALCAQVMRLRTAQIDVDIALPTNERLARLFENANWAHLVAPSRYSASRFKGFTQVPAIQFRDSEEQQRAVNRIVNAILGGIRDLDRRELAALEWSVNEITDNVLNHARSKIGGLVQVSTFQRGRKRIEYIVADAGVGIPSTLREGHPELDSDAAALDQAIREGVTRDKSIGQGNGLFGSYEICSHSNGFFQVESGYGKLVFTEREGLHVSTEKIPYEGTLVVAEINFSVPHLLEEALRFGGEKYKPVDFVELKYEKQGECSAFVMKTEAASFGSRPAGAPVRNKLANLARMCRGQRIQIDFADVPLVSSSFADEVFGKLFLELGPLTFMQIFEFRNVESTVKKLVDKAISQRMAEGK
jgi:hypothetical protein